jgi:hypothetical protein
MGHLWYNIAEFQRPYMQGKNKERWHELCEQAATEQDSAKLRELILEITRLLDEKQARLKGNLPSDPSAHDANET